MFEKITRMKLRFESTKGILNVEDLWDCSLEQLNKIAKTLNKELKLAEEEDFLKDKSTEDIKTKLKFEVVLYIIKTKKDEQEARLRKKDIAKEEQELLSLLEKKDYAEKESLTKEEILAKLKDLKK